MNIFEYQQWITEFYKKRNWYELSPFIRANFLTEEVGELARAIRTIEIGRDRPDETAISKAEQMDNLKEELGDVLDNVFILADKYHIDLTDIMKSHQEKLINRFQESSTPS